MIYVKLIHTVKCLSVVFLSLVFLSTRADHFPLFTHPFPVSWYEKGLHATIVMLDNFSHYDHHGIDNKSFDILLGRCAFVDFCFARMNEQGQILIDEDVVYVLTILHALEAKIVQANTIEQARVECFLFMNERIKKHLKMPHDI